MAVNKLIPYLLGTKMQVRPPQPVSVLNFSSHNYIQQGQQYAHFFTQFGPYRAWVADEVWNSRDEASDVILFPALRIGRRTGSDSGVMYMVGDTYDNRPVLALDSTPEFRMDPTQGDRAFSVDMEFYRNFYYNSPSESLATPGWQDLPPDTEIYAYNILRAHAEDGTSFFNVVARHKMNNDLVVTIEVSRDGVVTVSDPLVLQMPTYQFTQISVVVSQEAIVFKSAALNAQISLENYGGYNDLGLGGLEFFEHAYGTPNPYEPSQVLIKYVTVTKLA